MVKLLFSGDFVPILGDKKTEENYFSEISEKLSSADLHITNLECPITHSSFSTPKSGPSIKADREAVALLKQANVSIACLANNHIFDYGGIGIEETLIICEENQIETIGIVSRPDNRNHWIIREIKGRKIGFLNYCEHETSVRKQGLIGACGYDPISLYYEVIKIKKLVDFLIVIYHGGNEYFPFPNSDVKKAFHFLADLGADAVIGHHTHIYSGYEIYNGKPLVYSLGNFFFPSTDVEPESWYVGLLCELEIDNSIGLNLIPVTQRLNDFSITYPSSEQKKLISDRLNEISEIIKNDELLSVMWEKFVDTKGETLSKYILYPGRFERGLIKMGFKKFLRKEKRRTALSNIIRCQSLQKLLIDNLTKHVSRNP